MFNPQLGNRVEIQLNTKGDFVGQSFDAWPPPARAQRFRELANTAFVKAAHTNDDELQTEYLRLAAVLHAMASELEANRRHRIQPETSQDELDVTIAKAEPIP